MKGEAYHEQNAFTEKQTGRGRPDKPIYHECVISVTSLATYRVR